MKTPKRVKGYVNEYGDERLSVVHVTAKRARNNLCSGGRIARVVELRKGECIVDVEALKSAVDRYTAAWERAYATRTDAAADAVTECGWNLRAALRKVGKR